MSKPITKEEYEELKQEVEAAKSKAARAAGALEQSKKKLKEDFDCNSLGEAKKLLATTEASLEKASEEYRKLEKAYRAKWKQE